MPVRDSTLLRWGPRGVERQRVPFLRGREPGKPSAGLGAGEALCLSLRPGLSLPLRRLSAERRLGGVLDRWRCLLALTRRRALGEGLGEELTESLQTGKARRGAWNGVDLRACGVHCGKVALATYQTRSDL